MSKELDFREASLLFEEILSQNKDISIAIISHINPDADALGSITGLAAGLRNYFANASFISNIYCLNSGASQSDLHFIPKLNEIAEPININIQPTAIIVCDCGDLDRVGYELSSWVGKQNCPILSLDHHASNSMFGSINLVDTALSSTCELVYILLKNLGVAIDTDIATCLLAGILGDTGCFRYRSTTANTLTCAAELVSTGANLSFLAEHLYGSVPLSTIKLESKALQNIIMSKCGRVAGVIITEQDYIDSNADSSDGEMLAEKLRDIKGVIASYSIRVMEGKWKVSLRTTSSDVDLTTIAVRYGGGGHKAAAAFRFSGEPDIVSKDLQESLLKLVSRVQ